MGTEDDFSLFHEETHEHSVLRFSSHSRDSRKMVMMMIVYYRSSGACISINLEHRKNQVIVVDEEYGLLLLLAEHA